MCGIAGFIALDDSEQSQLRVIAAVLAVEIQDRGGQSWGTLDDEGCINKGIGPISGGLSLPKLMPRAYVMHTRFATHGVINESNAHPFTQGSVCGVHNGVISNHWDLNAKYDRDFDVDSQHIFQHISEGRGELADLQGYGAIVFREHGKWFAGTFNRGDLVIANTPLGKVYASTEAAVSKACRLAGTQILSWDVLNDDTVYEITPERSFKRFAIDARGTSAKWNDGYTTSKWFARGEKKSETLSLVRQRESDSLWGQIIMENLRKGSEGIVIEEHDESSGDLECVHCFLAVPPERHYVNVDLDIVCSECAKSSYCFIAPDEYAILDAPIKCDLCTTDYEDGFFLTDEMMTVCRDCFEIQYNTKGLTKVTNELVH